jgi:hypothetical protein
LSSINQALSFISYESNPHQKDILTQQRHDLKKLEYSLLSSFNQLYGDFNTLTLDHQGCLEKKRYYKHQYKHLRQQCDDRDSQNILFIENERLRHKLAEVEKENRFLNTRIKQYEEERQIEMSRIMQGSRYKSIEHGASMQTLDGG